MLRRILVAGAILGLCGCAGGPGSSDWEKRGQTVAVTYPEGVVPADKPVAATSAAPVPVRSSPGECVGSMQMIGGSGYACSR